MEPVDPNKRYKYGFRVSGLGAVEISFNPESYSRMMDMLRDDEWLDHYSHWPDCYGCRLPEGVAEVEDHEFRISESAVRNIISWAKFESQLSNPNEPSQIEKNLQDTPAEEHKTSFSFKFIAR